MNEGDDFPSFIESDEMIGDVVGHEKRDDTDYYKIQNSENEIKEYAITTLSDLRLIERKNK